MIRDGVDGSFSKEGEEVCTDEDVKEQQRYKIRGKLRFKLNYERFKRKVFIQFILVTIKDHANKKKIILQIADLAKKKT